MILWFLLVMQPFTDREWEFMHEYVDHKSSKKKLHILIIERWVRS